MYSIFGYFKTWELLSHLIYLRKEDRIILRKDSSVFETFSFFVPSRERELLNLVSNMRVFRPKFKYYRLTRILKIRFFL